jgi:RNA polymerase sigma-70 factor (ECF subfamily)
VQDHRPLIFRFLLAPVRDVDLAETLTQECLLKAYRNRLSFRGESSPRTWLLRITINLQKNYWRNRRIRFWREMQANAVDVDLVSDRLPSAERSPEAQLLAREQAASVSKVVESLRCANEAFFYCVRRKPESSEIGQCTGLRGVP